MAAVGMGTLVASFAYAPFVQHGPIVCPFRLFFGVPCPGCGLTRSFCAMSHGDVAGAFSYHALGPCLYLALLIGVPLLAWQALTRRRVPLLNEVLYARRPAYVFGALLFAYQMARLCGLAASGQLFADMQSSLVGHGLRLAMQVLPHFA
jgi:hypothetical protein